jgi:hypothetical protein
MNQKRTDMLQSAGTLIALVISIIAMVTSIYESKNDSHKEGKFKARVDYKN